jgi:serralysin
MATLTYYYINSIYPLGLDYNPGFGELVGTGTTTKIGTPTSTQATFRLENGLMVRAKGTGFVADADGDLTDAGTLTSLEVLSADGKAVLQKLTLSLSMQVFLDAYPFIGNLDSWLLNRADRITGSNGSDDIFAYGGNDVINAGAGDDFVEGGEGKDTCDGGTGISDQLSFRDAYFNADAYRGILLDATAGTVIDPYGNAETFKNFESFRGTQFADVFKGSTRAEQFMGLGGKDTIDGGGGFDVVRYHRDANFGGGAGVTVNLGAGTAIDGFGRADKLISIEAVRGTAFADKLTGSSVRNQLAGDAGNDQLAGGHGNDMLVGGAGKDTFLFNSALNGTTNVDTIDDFIVVDDTIRLENSVFTKLVGTGVLTAAQFAKNINGNATQADDRIIYETDTGNLFYDLDGSGTGAKVLFAKLDGGLSLTAADFFIV